MAVNVSCEAVKYSAQMINAAARPAAHGRVGKERNRIECAAKAGMETALLRTDRLSYSVGGKRILHEVDIALGEREIHALLGANGTGKTTLAYLIMGCAGYAPTAGRVLFRGRPIDAMPMHERAGLGITLAWQEPARFEGLLVRDYVSLGKAAADPAACLERVGLDPGSYLDRAVDKTLSGGERKRIELAAVLALTPVLAILDEPASGIDLLSITEIADVIRSFKREGGSVLLITHQQEVARVADRASHLCGGRIVFTGDPDSVANRYRSRRCVVCDGEACGYEAVE